MKSRLEQIYDNHREQLNGYYDKTGLSEIQKDIDTIKDSYQERDELIQDIKSNISVIINSIVNGSFSFQDKVTFRSDNMYVYNTNNKFEDTASLFTNVDFWEALKEEVEQEEEIEVINSFITKYVPTKSLEKEYDRSYNTYIGHVEGEQFFVNSYRNRNYFLQYNMEYGEVPEDKLGNDNGNAEEFNVIRLKKSNTIASKSSIALNSKKTIQIPEPDDMPSKDILSMRIAIQEEMNFLVNRALNEIKYDIYILNKLNQKLRENFGGLITLDRI